MNSDQSSVPLPGSFPEPLHDTVDEAWQHIANLHLRLRDSVKFYQHTYRGTPWLIIADQQNESYFRCTADVQQFLKLLDGTRSIEQAFSEVQDVFDIALIKRDIVFLIANLKKSNLLHEDFDTSRDGATQDNCSIPDTGPEKKKANSWLRPFSIKFALFDPDDFLENTVRYIKPWLGYSSLWVWLMFVVVALSVSILHWTELVEHGQARFNDPKNLLWYWLLYPLVKTLHELGHAYTTKAWGGVVHEMGVMLLVFFPVPYVDSSAANRFSSKNKRIMVSAAGIMVEVLLASLALLLWVLTEPGLIHDLAFDIVIIGGLSTLIFNANPLLRFDGYYIFSEFLEIPNLGSRSNQYIGYLFKRYVLDIADSLSPVTAVGEAKWLFVYGLCASIYRIFISLFIAFWVAGKLFIIGTALAIWAVFTQLFNPLIQWLIRLVPVVQAAQRLQRLGVVASAFIIIVSGSLLIPVGHSTYAEGLVNLPENALIRAGTDGIIKQVLVTDGVPVTTGTRILKLENLELDTRHDILLARLEEAHARLKEKMLQERNEAEIIKVKISSIETEIKDVNEQLKSLNITSTTSGIVYLPLASDLPGKYVKRGEIIGYIVDLSQVSARVVIPQSAIDDVQHETQSIYVRLRSRPDEILLAKFLRKLPQATDQLPSRLLGSGAGGEVAVDFRDESGVQTISNIFEVEISLPLRNSGNYLGQRVYVRFIHQRESLGSQLLHRLNLLLLQAPFV